MKQGIIIQARLGSSRLPGKMLRAFYKEKGILQLLIERLKEHFPELPIILATTNKPLDTPLAELAKKHEIHCYRGDENNVLSRFTEAAEKYKIQKIIRICADNPFLDMAALKNMADAFLQQHVDYWCYALPDYTPSIMTHYGFWGEGVSLNALKKVAKLTNNPLAFEHVTWFIHQNPEQFTIHYQILDKEIHNEKNVRLTIDTEADFITAREIYSSIQTERMPLEAKAIINFIKNNSRWKNTMRNEIEKNKK